MIITYLHKNVPLFIMQNKFLWGKIHLPMQDKKFLINMFRFQDNNFPLREIYNIHILPNSSFINLHPSIQ
ncbi:hypothetical protein PFFCH_03759 [Plasmodium falciparum FCH/4]|uniref:Uncharacterized protein n=1 Tax=Plasmodium falciparum FCH/4 TaxID=1036724 RepID=A0A024VJE8_PLAFA|nr:hypothetical protein PFFCH_03759 [Plasmodium falciparum FCH/4]